jgi:selenide, water dikinase
LIVGYAGADDAAVFRIGENRGLVVTTDFFPPMIDDPSDFGEVAAANALSDVFAMGGRPLVALNIVGFPKGLDLDILGEILSGGARKAMEAGAVVGGGHTVVDSEIKYGMAVTGEVALDQVWANGALRVGDVVLLTKPIGTGLITSAVKTRSDDGPAVKEAIRWMKTLNGLGIEHLKAADVSAATDVTGFGLLGHACEFVGGAGTLVIERDRVPRIPGVEDYFADDCRTRGSRESREFFGSRISLPDDLDDWDRDLLYDPQTSGGLLVGVRPHEADELVDRLRESGLELAAVIGDVRPREEGLDIRVT